MKFLKNKWASGIATFLFFLVISYGYAVSHHMHEAYVQLSHFINKSTYYLSSGVNTAMVVTSIIFILLWLGFAFFAGKYELNGVFRGMMAFSALPIIGALGIPFALKGNTLMGMLPIFFFFPWSAPIQPLFITEGPLDSFVTGIAISVVVMPLLAWGIYYFAKKVCYHNN